MLAFGLLPWLFLHLRHAPVGKQEQLPLSTPVCPQTLPHLLLQMICPWPGRAPISGEPLIQCKDPALESVSCQHVDHCLSVVLQHSPGPDMVDAAAGHSSAVKSCSGLTLPSFSLNEELLSKLLSPITKPHRHSSVVHWPPPSPWTLILPQFAIECLEAKACMSCPGEFPTALCAVSCQVYLQGKL